MSNLRVQPWMLLRRPIMTKLCLRTIRSERGSQVSSLFPARSWLFSGRTLQHFVKAIKSNADIIVLDLEDSTVQEMKSKMLQSYLRALRQGLFKGRKVFIRLCDLENSNDLVKQVNNLTIPEVYGFILPKLQDRYCLNEYDGLVKSAEEKNNLPVGAIRFAPIIDTLQSYFNAESITNGCGRNVAIITGTSDFRAEAYCVEKSTTLELFLGQVVLLSRAAQVLPIAGVCDKIDDHVRAEGFYRKMKASGFSGAAVLTPSQSTLANIAFSYSLKEVQWAQNIKDLPNGISVMHFSARTSRHMIGPPHKLIAARICKEDKKIQERTSSLSSKPNLLQGRINQKGLKDAVQVGGVIRSPLEITVTDSWKVLWESAFPSFCPIFTSQEFALRLGLKTTPLPFTFVNTLALALTVSSFSDSARVHLGCYNALMQQPLFPGDTVRSVCCIDDAKSVEGNKYTIVTSSHCMINQRDENVFTVRKRTMFPHLKIEDVAVPSFDQAKESSWKWFITKKSSAVLSSKIGRHQMLLSEGELIIHDDYKYFGNSETSMLCKLFRTTNSHHHNIIRYSSSDILVPDPFVIAAMVNNTEYDLGDVVYEEYPSHTNINKVNPGDQIGTITLVKSVRQLEGNCDLEEITLKHVGIKNVDLDYLVNSENNYWDVFDDKLEKPKHYEEFCSEKCPLLFHKIACQAVRKIIRVKPEAYVQ